MGANLVIWCLNAPTPVTMKELSFRNSLKINGLFYKQIESKHAFFLLPLLFWSSPAVTSCCFRKHFYSTAKPVCQFLSASRPIRTLISVFRPLFIRGIEGKTDFDRDEYVTGVNQEISLPVDFEKSPNETFRKVVRDESLQTLKKRGG